MVRLAIRPVKSIEERRVDQGAGPDHTAGIDEETAKETTQRKADQLCRESKQDLVCATEVLVVEHALCSDNICRICAANNYVSHNSDQDMLLDVKRARVQRPGTTKGVEAGSREKTLKGFSKGQSCQLSDDTCNNNRRI